MKIIELNLNSQTKLNEPLVACIGYFDGLHLGHQELIKKTIELALNKQLKKALISFKNDPKDFMGQEKTRHLQSLDEKIAQLTKYNLDYLILLEFDHQMLKMSVDQFHQFLKNNLNIDTLICGFDFHYAYKGIGNNLTLKQDFNLYCLNSIDFKFQKISTTRIKQALSLCDVVLANTLLGYDFYLKAKVLKGKQIGRNIGFPTANLQLESDQFYPANGVYAGYCLHRQKRYRCLINIGFNPTVVDDRILKVEVFLMDFNGNLYDEIISVYFLDYIRSEIKFDNLTALKKQIEGDLNYVKNKY